MAQEQLIKDFNDLYKEIGMDGAHTWSDVYWMGVPLWKYPTDLWIYQEIMSELKPDVLIETGTWKGGSALFFAHMFDLIGRGRVITIDIQPNPGILGVSRIKVPFPVTNERPVHPRITYVTGASTNPSTVAHVRSLISENEKVMAILDSDHSFENVLKEVQIYGTVVSNGQYLIIEDTRDRLATGARDAVAKYMATGGDALFDTDLSREKLMLTSNPRGFLKKKA